MVVNKIQNQFFILHFRMKNGRNRTKCESLININNNNNNNNNNNAYPR